MWSKYSEENFIHAREWFLKAADQGLAKGQIELGFLYAMGYGSIKKDPSEAYKWFTLAKDKEPAAAETAIELLKTNEMMFTSEQISEGERRAAEFKKTNHISSDAVKTAL